MDRTIKGPDGKMYPSISAMCRAYGISQALYYERQKRHYTPLEALTVPLHDYHCVDADGVEFDSLRDMLAYHKVSYATYRKRLKKGLSLRETLQPGEHYKAATYNGKRYKSLKDLCEDLGIFYPNFKENYRRARMGMPDERKQEALEIVIEFMLHPQKSMIETIIERYLKEHNIDFVYNKEFVSTPEIYKSYVFDVAQLRPDFYIPDYHGRRCFIEADGSQHFFERKFFGTSEDFRRLLERDQMKTVYIQKVLGCPLLRVRYDQQNVYSILDAYFPHLDEYTEKINPVLSIEQYYEKGNIRRLYPKLELKRASSKATAEVERITDHLGTVYPSLNAMVRNYGLTRQCYKMRLLAKMTKEEALTTPIPDRTVQDHKGNVYKDTKAMCDAYELKEPTFYRRRSTGYSLEAALTMKVNPKKGKRRKAA